MNPSKKDNGWILCPSKSFPGKFYYFNVLNGETAWSLNDADQKILRKDNDLQKADKSHSYPEPSSPPTELPTTSTSLNIQKTITNQTRKPLANIPPMFGQATFPTYISNVDPYMQNIIWTPIQLPMFSKPRQDQVTQTSEPDREIFVQSCTIPLTKRFINYEEPKNIFSFKTDWNLNNNEQSVKPNYFDFNKKNKIMTSQMVHPVQYSHNNKDQSVYSTSNVFCNNRTTAKDNSQLLMPKGSSQSMIKIVRQRTRSESDKTIDDAVYDHETFGVPSTQTFKPIAHYKRANASPIKKNSRQRTQSESDSIIYEKPTANTISTLTSTQKAHNAIQQNVVSSKTEDQPKSGFVLRKSVFSPSFKVHNENSPTKSTGTVDKEVRMDSLWSKQEKNKIGVLLGNLDKKDNKAGSLLCNRDNQKRNDTEKDLLDKLDKSDLRYTLEKKRRKSVDLGSSLSENKANYSQKETPKKKVTFNLENEISPEDVQECKEKPQHITISNLRRLVDRVTHCWYVAVDTSVLMEDYEFVDKFVQLDKDCRLLIPIAVQVEIESFCFGDCRGQQRVILARQLVRRLATPPPHIFVQPLENEDFPNMSTVGRILNCCLQMIQQDDHVVLVTKDVKLYDKAKLLKIHCYMLQQIKDGASKPEVLQPEPIKVTLKNDAKQNLFLQKDFDSFPNFKIPIDTCKHTLCSKENSWKNCDVQTDLPPTTDANTSPINFDESIDVNRGKSYLNFDFDSNSDTTEISRNMNRLVIRERNSNFMGRKINKNNSELEGRRDPFQIKNNISKQIQNFQKKNQTVNEFQNLNGPIQNIKIQFQREEKEKKTNYESRQFLQEKIKSSINEKLERFKVESDLMEENIRVNIEEWICTFVQILEYALSALLQDSNPALPAPWTVHEAVTCVKQLSKDQWACALADELSLLLLNYSCKKGKLKRITKPEEFMRLFGYGVLLMENLQATRPSPHIAEAQELLSEMLTTLQTGKEDLDLLRSPVMRRSGDDDDYDEPPKRHNFVKKSTEVLEYLKRHFPAWQAQTESTLRTEQVARNAGTQIVRTVGRNLSSLMIDKTKSIAMREPTDKESPEMMKLNKHISSGIHISQNTLLSIETYKVCDKNGEPNEMRLLNTSNSFAMKSDDKAGPRTMKLNKNDNSEFDTSQITIANTESTVKLYENSYAPKIVRLFDASTPFPKKKENKIKENEIVMSPKHGNTFGSQGETAGPKVIRNIKLIDAFEDKLKFKVDMDELNYSEIEETLSNASQCSVIFDNDSNNDKTSLNKSNNDILSFDFSNNNKLCVNYSNNDIISINDDKISIVDLNKETDDERTNVDSINDGPMEIQNNDSSKPNDSSTNDSGFVNENESYILVQMFLSELSISMKLIYQFIGDSMRDLGNKDLKSELKKRILDKANTTRGHLTGIIYKLQSIVQREADDVTPLKELILKADIVVASDKRLMRYRQVVMKCLEQAEMLDDALRILLAIADGDYDITFCSDRSVYFNIFE